MEAHPELRTDRLLLRPFRMGDVEDVFAYATDPEWARHLPVPVPYTRRDAEEFVSRAILADSESHLMWAIVHEGRGSGGIDLDLAGLAAGTAKMGYSLARPLWGRGLVTEAARAVVAYGFAELGLARIQAFADIRNVGSWRVMEKLGMQREGVLRSHQVVHEERTDDVVYAILREEWSPTDSGE